MAEVTKPIALDESLNTTESTPRNIADVLAEGLDNIAEAVVPRAATEIPITSGSATNTKDYIDSGLSGKEATITTTTGTITASANVSLIRPNAIKWGKVKTINCVFQVTGTATTIGTIPSAFAPTNTIDFSVNGDSGHGCRLQIVAGNTTIAIASAPTQNEYYAFTVTYI